MQNPIRASHGTRLGPMQIFVKNLHGKTLAIECPESGTIRDLMCLVHKKEGIPPELQRLIFGGRQLDEEWTLSDYNIQRESTVHLLLRWAGHSGGMIIVKRLSGNEINLVRARTERPSRSRSRSPKMHALLRRRAARAGAGPAARDSAAGLQAALAARSAAEGALRAERAALAEARRRLEAQDLELRQRNGDTEALKLLEQVDLENLTASLANALLGAQREHRRKCRAFADEFTCVACCTERRRIVLEPCRHLTVCRACFEMAGNRCPLCRSEITGYIDIFV